MAKITQDLFSNYQLTIRMFAGWAWSEPAGFVLGVPEDATINSITYYLRLTKLTAKNLIGQVTTTPPCIDVAGLENILELNGHEIMKRYPHVTKDQIVDGMAWTTIPKGNTVRIALHKTVAGAVARVDGWFDVWVEVDYTVGASGEEPKFTWYSPPTPAPVPTGEEEATTFMFGEMMEFMMMFMVMAMMMSMMTAMMPAWE